MKPLVKRSIHIGVTCPYELADWFITYAEASRRSQSSVMIEALTLLRSRVEGALEPEPAA